MILARAPLRISIGGGGTDMPAYYKLGGTVFSSMAINQYVYVASNIRFFNKILIRYSKNEYTYFRYSKLYFNQGRNL